MRRTLARRLMMAIVALVAWHLATVPWGMRMSQLIAFVAPGAVIGAGAGWAYAIADAPNLRWRTTSSGAVAGAMVLPPFLAVLIGLAGASHPSQLGTLFVMGAWLTLLVSAGAGAIKLLVRVLRSPDRRVLMRERWHSAVQRRGTWVSDRHSARRERRAAARHPVQPQP